MTTTATLTATGTLIGTCVKCGTVYRTTGERGFCACRATTPCNCSADEPGHVHPQTFIKWGVVAARYSANDCSEACRSAKSLKCACACGGDHHGEAFGMPW